MGSVYVLFVTILTLHFVEAGWPKLAWTVVITTALDLGAFTALMVLSPRARRLIDIYWNGDWMYLGYGRMSWSGAMALLDTRRGALSEPDEELEDDESEELEDDESEESDDDGDEESDDGEEED